MWRDARNVTSRTINKSNMNKKRKIPSTMVTQHPDHAAAPYWQHEPYISAAQETKECFLSFADLGASEYKWDWEGKLVDEAVIDRLFAEHFEYFQYQQLGRDKFLTFRLPNPKVETEYRLGRAFMGMISASSLSRHIGYSHSPIFEVILPMTESAEEMIAVQEAFAEMASLKHPLLKHEFSTLKHIEMIPLFEQIDIIADSDKILEKYISLHTKIFGSLPPYMRPYLARSDPALNAGLVPTVLAIKLALRNFVRFEEKYGIKLYPIIGAASLPFRGGLTPDFAEQFAVEYSGIRTTTIQSGFKYDFPKTDVIRAISVLDTTLPNGKPDNVSKHDEVVIRNIMKNFERHYQSVIGEIAPVINQVARSIPKRRERVQHIGLFGYSRGIGNVKLPRAIGFTGSMYSIGIPPEFIGTGRGIAYARKKGWLPIIERYYKNFRSDMMRSGAFLNKKNIAKLAKISNGWTRIAEDIRETESYLGITFDPQSNDEKEHHKLTDKIFSAYKNGTLASEYIEQAALRRKSLG